jgi:hypothetical protein
MPSTYTLISSNVLASSAASVTFSAIPSTYTDFEILVSARNTDTGTTYLDLTINSDGATNYSGTRLEGNGATVGSNRYSSAVKINTFRISCSTDTANTFSGGSIYIPNYTTTAAKPISMISHEETNSTTAYINAQAALYRGSSAITSFTLTSAIGSFVANSSFYLYGISKS